MQAVVAQSKYSNSQTTVLIIVKTSSRKKTQLVLAIRQHKLEENETTGDAISSALLQSSKDIKTMSAILFIAWQDPKKH